MGAKEASSEMTVYTDSVEDQAMMNPYTAPAGPPLSKAWAKMASTVSQVMSSQTAKPNMETKPKRRFRTCFLPNKASVASSASRPRVISAIAAGSLAAGSACWRCMKPGVAIGTSSKMAKYEAHAMEIVYVS